MRGGCVGSAIFGCVFECCLLCRRVIAALEELQAPPAVSPSPSPACGAQESERLSAYRAVVSCFDFALSCLAKLLWFLALHLLPS